MTIGAGVLRLALRPLPRRHPHPHEHRALRWIGTAELTELAWVPADTAWLPQLDAALRRT